MKWQEIAARWPEIKVRFARMVGQPTDNGCRLWLGSIDSATGYGSFSINAGYESRGVPAHRVAYAVGVDDFTWIVPTSDKRASMDHVVRHVDACPHKHCVEFAHLLAGTQQENIDDNRRTGKILFGEKIGNHKLTEAQVIEIRAALALVTNRSKTGRFPRGTFKQLATQYDVTNEEIGFIAHGKTWKHLM